MVLTEGTDQLHLLYENLGDTIKHCFVLHGRVPKKQRKILFVELNDLGENAPRVILATGRLIGEGFDHPPLDTLVLAMPISWKGTLQQYAGRLHREHVDKEDVRIYDYIEPDQTPYTITPEILNRVASIREAVGRLSVLADQDTSL